MTGTNTLITGGCLCGALRWEAKSGPDAMGHCYCCDCRKASGSGFIPFAMFPAESLTITGPILAFSSKAANGNDAIRNSCAKCGSLVFGGPLGRTDNHSIYVGSADDPSWFKPKIAIFVRDAPGWASIPPGLTRFEKLPG
jgi:hypothetical protein